MDISPFCSLFLVCKRCWIRTAEPMTRDACEQSSRSGARSHGEELFKHGIGAPGSTYSGIDLEGGSLHVTQDEISTLSQVAHGFIDTTLPGFWGPGILHR